MWQTVTVAFAPLPSASQERGQRLADDVRATDDHDFGPRGLDVRCASASAGCRPASPARSARCPVSSRPRLYGWKPSASLSGSTAFEHDLLRRCAPVEGAGRGCREPLRRRSGRASRARSSSCGMLAGRSWSHALMPTSAHALRFPRHVDVRCGVVADQHRRQARSHPSLAQFLDSLGDLGPYLGRHCLPIDDPCRHRLPPGFVCFVLFLPILLIGSPLLRPPEGEGRARCC